MIKTDYKNDDSVTVWYFKRRLWFTYNRPTMQAIGNIVKKFEETGVVTNIERSVHHRFACSAQNIAIVSENVVEDTNALIPCRSQECGLKVLRHIMAYFAFQFTSTSI